MSLSVKHLNGDSTFLLTFSPTHPRHTQPGPSPPAGTFTILLDPWLSGDSTVFHPKFALSKRTIPACINHLSDISPPDVIIVSQDKPDHCHEETLRQLGPALPHTVILAHPAAAKRIRAWKYFDPNKVHALPMFAEQKPQSLVRFHLPGPTLDASPGEVTVALIAPKRDMTGLHTAIGITYCGPSFSNRISLPISTLQRPQSSHVQRPQSNSSAFDLPVQQRPQSNASAFDLPIQQYPFLENLPPSPPDTPCSYGAGSPTSLASPVSDNFFPRTATSSVSSAPSITQSIYTPFRAKAMSVIYSPHGITYPILVPYVTSHLVSKAALPLTLLLHSFDRVQNPWYLGGNISAGVPGGLGIAQSLLAKCWISAHDEEKESSGLSIKKMVTSKYTVEEVKALAEAGRKGGKAGVDVRKLGCGEEVVLMP